MQNIVLIGFMGSGKTSIGRELALLQGKFLLDSDQMIECNMGKSIVEIFSSVGESGFRRIESQLISWLKNNVTNAIISTGGGMPIHNDIKGLGIICYLSLSFEQIQARLDENELQKRPLFKNEKQARKLFFERQKIYENLANYIITATASPQEIARELSSIIRQDS